MRMAALGDGPRTGFLARTRRWLGPPFAGINDYEYKVRSQNGEDGILAALFRSLGTSRGYGVEFGVGDGSECNLAHLVKDRGWWGLMMEADRHSFERLREEYRSVPNVTAANEVVAAENVAALFARYQVPVTFDLLSIDVDGNDYWIWRALGAYRPQVVVIEYNAAHPPPEKWVMEYNPRHRWDGTTYYGASLTSLTALGRQLGYALVGTDMRGVNAFFVSRDALQRVRFPELPPEKSYHPAGFFNQHGTIGHPQGEGPFIRV